MVTVLLRLQWSYPHNDTFVRSMPKCLDGVYLGNNSFMSKYPPYAQPASVGAWGSPNFLSFILCNDMLQVCCYMVPALIWIIWGSLWVNQSDGKSQAIYVLLQGYGPLLGTPNGGICYTLAYGLYVRVASASYCSPWVVHQSHWFTVLLMGYASFPLMGYGFDWAPSPAPVPVKEPKSWTIGALNPAKDFAADWCRISAYFSCGHFWWTKSAPVEIYHIYMNPSLSVAFTSKIWLLPIFHQPEHLQDFFHQHCPSFVGGS